jgi:hypothetical protein
MRVVRPRNLTHRGVVEAAAFLVDTLNGAAEARRRVLALWVPGATVYRDPRGWLIRLPEPRRVRCDQAPGLPLTAEKVAGGRALVSAPFAAEELRTLDPPEGATVRLHGGATRIERPAETDRVDPAAWLDVACFAVTGAASLGPPPVEPKAHPPGTVAFDPRTRLKGVPPASPQLAEVLAALRSREQKPARGASRSPLRSAAGTMAHWLHSVRWSMRALRRQVVRLDIPDTAGRPDASGISSAPVPRPSGAPSGIPSHISSGTVLGAAAGAAAAGPWEFGIAGAEPRRRATPGIGRRLTAAFHQLTARVATASRLSRVMGRRHAAYIHRMVEMFERGDIREALRYAIPLGGPEADALRGVPLRLPGPRADLEIRPSPGSSWSVARMAPDLYGELQRLYRAAFERLEAQGHIEEAAFVLAEVLHAHEEAVAFLERHGRLRLAAEMAEARNLAPGLVVRQWFLTGDRERALWIARRSGAFADAVTRLERSRKREEARALRLLWGADLAEAGDYVAAVEAVWPVFDARRTATAWMDRAIEQGGAPAGRMLARKLTLVPEEFEATREQAINLLESWRAEGAAARLAFADTLRQGPRTPQAMCLARAAVRTMARDSGRFGARMSPAQFRQLVSFADDGALRADAPALPLDSREPWTSRTSQDTPWRLEIGPSDIGTMPALDAAFLPNGLTLVALGEAGVRLLSRSGRTVAEFDQPAHRLVVADNGHRALALARRGDSWRIARLDLATRRAQLWCDARLDAFAGDHDGVLWFVGAGDGLVAIDVTSDRFDGPWGVPDLGRRVRSIVRSPARCSLLTAEPDPEVWTYELPSLFLRSRHEAFAEEPPAGEPGQRTAAPPRRSLGAAAEGTLAEQWTLPAESGAGPAAETPLHVAVHGRSSFHLRLPGCGWTSSEPVVSADWLAAPVHGPEESRIYLIHRETARVRAEVLLARAGRVSLRLTPAYLTLADDRGRVLVLDLEHGQVRRDQRL